MTRRKKRINLRVVYTLFSALFIIVGTIIAILYTKGNFRLTRRGILQESGILSANSFPPGAQVFVDGELLSATDDTLYLEPGDYLIEIKKEGFSPWQKALSIKKELVTQTNAQLFPTTPSLTPLTVLGTDKVLPSPDGQKLLFYTASASDSSKQGLYVLELADGVLPFNRQARQVLTDSSKVFDFENSEYVWSPDSTEILVMSPFKDLRFAADKKNDNNFLANMRGQRTEILSSWEEEMYLRERQFLGKFPEEVIEIATKSAKNVYISPDKKRLLYTAMDSVNLATDLVPPIPSRSTQEENRDLEPGSIYIYDREEDTNFLVGTDTSEQVKTLLATDLDQKQVQTLQASPSAFRRLQATESAQIAQNFAAYHTTLYTHGLQWFTDSKHLLYLQDGVIRIKEYDNGNDTALYAGPFAGEFVYPWPDGSKVLILTSFGSDQNPNLYAVELK